jgi:hypothetical protein
VPALPLLLLTPLPVSECLLWAGWDKAPIHSLQGLTGYWRHLAHAGLDQAWREAPWTRRGLGGPAAVVASQLGGAATQPVYSHSPSSLILVVLLGMSWTCQWSIQAS